MIEIVVPCYNEEKRLDSARFLQFIESNPAISFLFVNDGSKDGTLKVLKLIQERFPKQVAILDLEKNGGKAEAVRQGIMVASAQAEMKWVGFWDADLATPLDEILRFQQLIDNRTELKMIMGCRFRHLGSNIDRKPSRHYVGRIFATIVSMMLKLPVYDTQCGAKLFEAQLAQKIFATSFISRWLFDVELLFRSRPFINPQQIYELPLCSWMDVNGSRLKFSDFLKSPFILAKIYLAHRNSKN